MAPDIIERFESVIIASALSTALIIYPYQISPSTMTVLTPNFLQLGRVVAGHSGQFYHRRLCQHCDTHYVSRHRTHNHPLFSPTRYR